MELKEKKQKNNKKIIKLSKLIRRWLTVSFLCVFLISVAFTYFSERKKVEENAYNLIVDGFNDVKIHLENSLFNDMVNYSNNLLYSFDDEYSLMSVNEAKIGDYNGDGTKNDADINDFLVAKATENRLFEVNIIDENGIIVYSTNPYYIGFDMINSGEQSRSFYENTKNDDAMNWYVQPLMPISYSDDIEMFYIGKYFEFGNGLLKDGWMIQTGANYDEVSQIYRYEMAHVPTSHRIGESGTIFAISGFKYADEDEVHYYIIGMSGGDLTNVNEDFNLEPDAEIISILNETDEGELSTIKAEDEKVYVSYEKMDDIYLVGTIPYEEVLRDAKYLIVFMILIEFIIFALLYATVYLFINFQVIKKITEISDSLADISRGNLDRRADVRNTREFNGLSDDINTTVDTLKAYIKEAETRIDQELAFARAIQFSVLPTAFPDRDDFELTASMNPAKEVGGDFYDFFMLDDDHLGLLIADVSGKGIPAAMFMMNAKALLYDRAKQGGTPGDILTDVNKRLCEKNKNDFFVTVWFAIIDLTTGKGMSTNAGHEHPALMKKDGKYDLIKYRHMMPIASTDIIKYKNREFTLNEGDRIFVYTDGVTEATDSKNELFGEERLIEALNRTVDMNTEQTVKSMKESIDAFVGDAEQFDDLTMLSFIFKGRKGGD